MENIELMGICQRLALEASNVLKSVESDSSVADPESSSNTTGVPSVEKPSAIENDIRDVLRELGWADISPTAVASMAGVLEEMSTSGYHVGRDTIIRHIQALAAIAGRNTVPIIDSLSRDQICVEVVRGITMHNRLLVATSALVHASLSAMPRSSYSSESQATKFV